MNEDLFRREIQHLFRERGYWDYHPPDDSPAATPKQIEKVMSLFKIEAKDWNHYYSEIRKILNPPAWKRGEISLSRPDIINYSTIESTVVVECKMIEPKKEIEPYLNPAQISDGQRNWLDAWKYQASGAAYLAIGTREGNPRRAWLIPWDWYVELEKRLIKEDLNFKVTLSMLSDEFELIWIPESQRVRKSVIWQLKEEHPMTPRYFPEASPYQVDWKQKFSLRFGGKEKDGDSNTN
jgi:hypothetical protein